jgi:membrane protein
MIKRIRKNRLIVLTGTSLKEFNAENGTLLAASIAFSTLFSLCPMVFLLVYIAGRLPQWPNLQNQIARGIEYMLPMSKDLLESIVQNVGAAQDAIGALALIGLVWGSISVFNSVRVSLNAIYGNRKASSLIKEQLINMGMMLGVGILMLFSVLGSTLLGNISEADLDASVFGLLGHSLATRIITNLLITVIAFAIFLLLYKLILVPRPKWKEIWVSSLTAAILFEITKLVFVRYIRIFTPYNMVYGSIGTLIAFLMWIYLSALIFLFIAKINHVSLSRQTNSNDARG